MRPPAITCEQREDARLAALQARRERSDLLASVRSGTVSVAQVLESTAPAHQRMRVRDLLRSLPGIGPIRSSQVLDAAGIAHTKRVGGLTRHQRDRLLRQLGTRSGSEAL